MMKILFSLVLVFICNLFCLAQTSNLKVVEHIEDRPYLDSYNRFFGEMDEWILIGKNSLGIALYEKYSIGIYTKNFDFVKDLNLNKLELPGEIEFYYLNKNGIFTVGYSSYSNSTTVLFVSDVDIKSFQVSNTREILRVGDINLTGTFSFFTSKNGSKIGVRSFKPGKKKFTLDYVVGVYDDNFNKIWNNQVVLPYERLTPSKKTVGWLVDYYSQYKDFFLTEEGRFAEIFRLENSGKGSKEVNDFHYHIVEINDQTGVFNIHVLGYQNEENIARVYPYEGINGELKIAGDFYLKNQFVYNGVYNSSLLWDGLILSYLDFLPIESEFFQMVKPSVIKLPPGLKNLDNINNGFPYFYIQYIQPTRSGISIFYAGSNYGFGTREVVNGDIFRVDYDNNSRFLGIKKIDMGEIITNVNYVLNKQDGSLSLLLSSSRDGLFLARLNSSDEYEIIHLLNYHEFKEFKDYYIKILSNTISSSGDIFFILDGYKNDKKIVRLNINNLKSGLIVP